MIWKHTEALRIDWEKAIKEAEDSFNKNKDISIAELLCKVHKYHRQDDVTAYLELLDNNRKILKA